KRAYLRSFFAGTAAWLYTGEQSRRFCAAYGAPPGRMFHVPYAVDNDRFAAASALRDAARRALQFEPDRLVVLVCGKLTANKRPLDVVEAVARAGDPGLTLLVAGDGELRGRVRSLAATRGVDLRLLGFVN